MIIYMYIYIYYDVYSFNVKKIIYFRSDIFGWAAVREVDGTAPFKGSELRIAARHPSVNT